MTEPQFKLIVRTSARRSDILHLVKYDIGGTSSMKIVVIGGSGLIGTKLVKRLRETSHEVIAASPNSGVNTIIGEGLFNRRCFARPIGANQTSAGFC